jgi:lipoprotein-anchoring transpeptidase ErfK/SrfK
MLPHPAAIKLPMREIPMALRVAGALTALIGLAAFTGDAAAQYDSYRYPYVPGPYRGAPYLADDDDDLGPPRPRREIPGGTRREAAPYPSETRPPYERRYEQAAPYPYETRPPYDRRYDRSPYDRRYEEAAPVLPRPSDVERQPLYDPYQPYRRAPAQGDYATRPQDPPPVIRAPGERGFAGPPQDAQPGMRPPADLGAARPPMDIAPSGQPSGQPRYAALPPGDEPEEGPAKELPAHLKRQLVDYATREVAGTIVIDTANTYLYLVLGNGKAMRYGIGVGRDGFTWSGRERISRMAEWPDWHPPAEMIERQPYLPRFMAGGESNPLGARALYLGKTLFRIHGTNQPSTIGTFVSSGCVRLTNADIEDLYGRVTVGSQVVVLPGKPPAGAGTSAQR